MNFPTQETLSRCTQIAAQLQQATQDSADHQRLILAVHFLQTHLACDLSLDEVAAAAYLSVRGLSGLFKRFTGLSPGHYIKLAKMEAARQLLTTEPLSVSEVIERVGIKDYSHFSRDFHELYGISPAQYRDYFPRASGNKESVG